MLCLAEWEEIATKDEAVSFEEPGQGSLGYFLSCYNYVSQKNKQYIRVFYYIIDILSIWLYWMSCARELLAKFVLI